MKLSVISTGSKGNAYVLTGEHCALLLDCGVPFKRILPYIEKEICGCLITHEHGDHASGANDVAKRGIDIYASNGTLSAIGVLAKKPITSKWRYDIGEFTVLPFDVEHDAKEPFGYMIKHKLSGETFVYATDTYYLKYRFPKINYWLVECNYVDDMMNTMMVDGEITVELRNRLKTSHMSLDHLKGTLKANDMTETRKVIICHLSDTRSDEARMVRELSEVVNCDVVAAHDGDTIELTLCPF